MFAHFGRLLIVLLKFSTMTPEQMLARVEFEGEERVRAAHALARACSSSPGHFGYWEINALVHALRAAADGGAGAAARQSAAARPARAGPRPDRQLGDLPPGAVRRVLRALGANQAVAC